ncbi:hypothetical protein [Vibrio phage JSF7]|uniref:Uncharacterized protein n=1 Tax=Vibrio phage JSF7 TaxID=1292086 RepID=A0A240EWU5_9CAUD|nr:hypothetical protein HOQ92_gp11 [Vibrio phage JSF7]APD18135.1 hypothetical protein [Vibrio phage JSF7]
MAMRRVNDLFKVQGLACYLKWKYPNLNPRIEVVPDGTRIDLEIWLNNSLVGQIKRLTPNMASHHWLDLVYANYTFVNEALFRDMSYDSKWWSLSAWERAEHLADAKKLIKNNTYNSNKAIVGGNGCTTSM